MNSNKSNRSRSKSVLYLNLRGHIHLYVLPFNTLVVLTLICIYATDDPKKTQHLLSLDGAQERLHLFKADLLEEGSFDSAVEGCNGVFHTASPVALEDINPQWVDVRDVANAHIQAYEIPKASGRYCLVERDLHYLETLKILRKLYTRLPLPEKCADDKPYAPSSQVYQEKAKSLGIHFTPLEVSLKDTVESLKGKNFVSF
ncbi:hypothetical protein VitviT2T_020007 [Vitis vinifera]|uniref:Cinnamoyl-CoA reductase 1 n=2 Tax=Vitis vinifera TaxID=29760 RepID=A0ABY9D4L2_VITVI|nr:Cinnamoyl-CoA reductase 1 [Vitis vinifera]WKA01741.1 hypothetical protein VitviT2T_020007 [Vitis vinifera]